MTERIVKTVHNQHAGTFRQIILKQGFDFIIIRDFRYEKLDLLLCKWVHAKHIKLFSACECVRWPTGHKSQQLVKARGHRVNLPLSLASFVIVNFIKSIEKEDYVARLQCIFE